MCSPSTCADHNFAEQKADEYILLGIEKSCTATLGIKTKKSTSKFYILLTILSGNCLRFHLPDPVIVESFMIC